MKYINILIFLLISLSWNTSYGEPTLNGDTLQNVESEYQEETDDIQNDVQTQEEQIETETPQTSKVESEQENTGGETLGTVLFDLVITALMVSCK